MRAHEFTENIADYSMCICGIPALTHDVVHPRCTCPTDSEIDAAIEAATNHLLHRRTDA